MSPIPMMSAAARRGELGLEPNEQESGVLRYRPDPAGLLGTRLELLYAVSQASSDCTKGAVPEARPGRISEFEL